jgi:uncharacterized protein (DUF2384 family)
MEEFNSRRIQKVLDKTVGIIKEDKRLLWMNTPNEELDNNTPLQMISKGSKETKEVLALLNRIEWGIPS